MCGALMTGATSGPVSACIESVCVVCVCIESVVMLSEYITMQTVYFYFSSKHVGESNYIRPPSLPPLSLSLSLSLTRTLILLFTAVIPHGLYVLCADAVMMLCISITHS